ncbi:hypothetical protein Bca4012_051379 [Brassica carinata]|uniref:(rape) hypothetical protein n=1 Tax=Brassica napus TaxID=3708 RepID=A0A816KHZ3_BRANA|nr:unnamed protein product [Brassica napus]
MVSHKETVCVTGASGFIGSWLVMRLLERGYFVRATVRDPIQHLLDLPKANTQVTLWKADLSDEGSYDDAINGCDGVFHVATPMDFEPKDPKEQTPYEESCLLRLLERLMSRNMKKMSIYDENDWSDLDFVMSKKMTGWTYFLSKTLAEKAAWNYANLITALSPITRNEAHYSIIRHGQTRQYVYLDDLCNAHIFVYEQGAAKGRYVCSMMQQFSLSPNFLDKNTQNRIITRLLVEIPI